MPKEHDFPDEFSACAKCGKYVEQLMNKKFCTGKKIPLPPEKKTNPYWLRD